MCIAAGAGNVEPTEDFDCIHSHAKNKERLDAENKDHAAAAERKAFHCNAKTLQEQRYIERKARVKSVLDLEKDQLYSYPALMEIANNVSQSN